MKQNQRIEETRQRLLDNRAIVAVRLGAGAPLIEVCRALQAGGLKTLELTLTTPDALSAIEELSADEELLVGGGTVLSVEDVAAVAEAGGAFALSPVLNRAVIAEAHRRGLLAVPGAATPTEILAAHESGADLVKVFPAGPLGGPDYLRKVRGPLPDIPLVPTSGPTAKTIPEYLEAGAAAVGVGGDELFPAGFSPQIVEKAARRVSGALG
jgi:2-dehydro-3-deoxyphosphogluconate aldolase/(4S)-4-hydroxy-2-oxoglutarate aldolase